MSHFITETQMRFNSIAKDYIEFTPSPPILKQAMLSSLNQGGKRLRPLLVYATGLSLGLHFNDLDAPALAIELIHTYSLIHDDLPSMDNADFRRGKPSCHKTYGEANAILAGDALQTLAFEVLASYPSNLDANKRLSMINVLAKAAGANGMVGGQILDLQTPTQFTDVLEMYAMKTGALIKTSIHLGTLAASDAQFSVFEKFADILGLAFQIQDDLLDIESTTEMLGKPSGLDEKNKKNTIPHLKGINEAKEWAAGLFNEAYTVLNKLKHQGDFLRDLLQYIQLRKK